MEDQQAVSRRFFAKQYDLIFFCQRHSLSTSSATVLCSVPLKHIIQENGKFCGFRFHPYLCRCRTGMVIFMETLRLIGFIVYCLAGYWAVNRTIYANYVLYGDLATIFMRKVIVGMLAGPVCIPLAIIKTVAGKKGGDE